MFQEVLNESIHSNISGVAMGNAFISPLDSTLSWAPFLYQVSLVDEAGMEKILTQAMYTKEVYDSGDYAGATTQWSITQYDVLEVTDGVDFYNVLNKVTKNTIRDERKPIGELF
jgi:serine carboxypeptidase 1